MFADSLQLIWVGAGPADMDPTTANSSHPVIVGYVAFWEKSAPSHNSMHIQYSYQVILLKLPRGVIALALFAAFNFCMIADHCTPDTILLLPISAHTCGGFGRSCRNLLLFCMGESSLLLAEKLSLLTV